MIIKATKASFRSYHPAIDSRDQYLDFFYQFTENLSKPHLHLDIIAIDNQNRKLSTSPLQSHHTPSLKPPKNPYNHQKEAPHP